jgi:predicted small secreted protein
MNMKKTMAAIASVALAAATAYAAYVVRGHGKIATATTTPTIVLAGPGSNDTANVCSIYNLGNEVIFFQKNTTTGQFVLANSIPIPAGSGYSTSERGGALRFICIATSTNTSEFAIAFE